MGIFSVETHDVWYKGKITVCYNLAAVLHCLLLIAAAPFCAVYFLLKFLCKGLYWLICELWAVLKKSWVLLAAFRSWFKALFNKKRVVRQNGMFHFNWRWIVMIITLLLALLLCLKGCSDKHKNKAQPTISSLYDVAFDRVVVARAYLDGVQDDVTEEDCPRALVGFKFINDKSVKEYDFAGLTYDQAVAVVAADWKPLVLENLNPEVELTEQQMAVITLAAMRMGKNGFLRSTFLKEINQGHLDTAERWLLLEDADGNIRQTGDEPKQYFYILRILWNHEIDIRHLYRLPMFSYKGLKVDEIYNADSSYVISMEILRKLERGYFRTPEEALNL